MKALLVVTHGGAVRNFLLGSFPKRLLQEGEVHVWHPFEGDVLVEKCGAPEGLRWGKIARFKEDAWNRALRHSTSFAHMYWADTRSMRFKTSRKIQGSWRHKLVRQSTKMIGRLLASPSRIDRLAKAHCSFVARTAEVEEYKRRLHVLQPDVAMFGHYRSRDILPIVLAARDLGIPTVAFIFSWDNLTCKGRISSPFDHYLVWSDHMRDEMVRYYPAVALDRIHVTGTPQFDIYSDASNYWTREQFFSKVGANPARKIVCFSGGSPSTCPEDHKHLRLLLELIRAGRIPADTQVILRSGPGDSGQRYEPVIRDHPELIVSPPEWIRTRFGTLPRESDTELLANLIQHCDLNVNQASTMTLDFAIHDKPVVNVAFDVDSPPPLGVPIGDLYYEYEHYRPVVNLGAARAARTEDDLVRSVNDYLGDPALDREARRRFVEMQINVLSPIGDSTENVVKALREVSKGKNTRSADLVRT